MTTVHKDFEEFFEALDKCDVQYLIVGGYAFAIYATPRFTQDIDVFIARTEENATRLKQALIDFGFGSLDVSLQDLMSPDKIIQLGVPPLRIDILTSISGVLFEEAWTRKTVARYGNQKAFFIGKEDLIRNKKASGRKKDLRDAEDLLEE